MGVANDGCCTTWNDGTGKLGRLKHRALQVDVGVHQAGADEPASQIYHLAGLVLAKTHHAPFIDANVGGVNFAGEDIDQLCVL